MVKIDASIDQVAAWVENTWAKIAQTFTGDKE
jgi:hypothetical protein